MKNPVLCLLYLFFIQLSQAQTTLPFDPATRKILYSASVTAGSTSQKILYSKSLDWFALNFNPANAVIETNDSARGEFVITGSFDDSLKLPESPQPAYYAILTPTVTYTLQLEITTGSCRIRIGNLKYKYYIPGPSFASSTPNGITNQGTFESQYESTLADRTLSELTKQAWVDFFNSCDKRLRAIISSYQKQMQKGGDGF